MRLGNVKSEETWFLLFAVALAFRYICIAGKAAIKSRYGRH